MLINTDFNQVMEGGEVNRKCSHIYVIIRSTALNRLSLRLTRLVLGYSYIHQRILRYRHLKATSVSALQSGDVLFPYLSTVKSDSVLHIDTQYFSSSMTRCTVAGCLWESLLVTFEQVGCACLSMSFVASDLRELKLLFLMVVGNDSGFLI